MNIEKAQQVYDDELPDFEDHDCETPDCGEDSDTELKGHWLCKSCLDNVLSSPRGEIAMSVLGRLR